MKVVIVGGVAGGASAAARLRRNDETARIILFERGNYISFANCGLPYYIGGVIHEKSKLTVQTPERFRARFHVDVRTGSEVVAIDRPNKRVRVRRAAGGSAYEESYDKLILSPGAEPIRPRLPGFDNPKVFTLRSLPDTFAIDDFCEQKKPRSAVVIGGGYIGIEIAENLHRRGITVTIAELSDHVIPPIDADTAAQLHNHLRSKGVRLLLNTGVSSIADANGGLSFRLSDGREITADFSVLAAGVAPESTLARDAGLKTGLRGAILTDDTLRTSDPDIYAVGDAIQVTNAVSGAPSYIPLASPANRQGRIAADNICGRELRYGGAQGSSVLKVFDMTLAATGLSETALKAQKIPYRKSYTYSPSNAAYYPGGLPMSIKLLFAPDGGRILGAQALGFSGVDKRMDVIAAVVRLGGTVQDLTELELCYAPPFSSAKDPVNMAGYAAENILRGLVKPFYTEDTAGIDPEKELLLDVRTKAEFQNGTIPGAVNIPLDDLRTGLSGIPKDKPVFVFCQIGLRGYLAARILMQSGFTQVRNLSGGYRLWKEIQNDRNGLAKEPEGTKVETDTQMPIKSADGAIVVDACGLSCPGPITAVRQALDRAKDGDVLLVRASDPSFPADIAAFCRRTGHRILQSGFDGKSFCVTLKKAEKS